MSIRIVSKKSLRKFIARGGYDLVKGFGGGTWREYGLIKHLSETLKDTKGLSRGILIAIGQTYPTLEDAEKALKPKRVEKTQLERGLEKFTDQEAWKKVETRFGKRKSPTIGEMRNFLYTAWKELGKKPFFDEYGKSNWTGDDFRKLRDRCREKEQTNPIHTILTTKVGEEKIQKGMSWTRFTGGKPDMKPKVSNSLRDSMRAMGNFTEDIKDALYKTAKGIGERKEWTLTEPQCLDLIDAFGIGPNKCDRLDILMLAWLGMTQGARISAFSPDGPRLEYPNALKVRSFYYYEHWKRYILHFFEPKMKGKAKGEENKRPLTTSFAKLLEDYINTFYTSKEGKLDSEAYLFPQSHHKYNEEIKALGEYAKIVFPPNVKPEITSHCLKHTAVSLMVEHKVPQMMVQRITHTDWATLDAYYARESDTDMMITFGVTEVAKVPWDVWLETELYPRVKAKYYLLKARSIRVDGVVISEKTPEPTNEKPTEPEKKGVKALGTIKGLAESTGPLSEWAKKILKERGEKPLYHEGVDY